MEQLTTKQIKQLLNTFLFITIKDIMLLTNVSKKTASRLYSDIKLHYDLNTKPTISHLKDYLKIPVDDLKNVKSGQK